MPEKSKSFRGSRSEEQQLVGTRRPTKCQNTSATSKQQPSVSEILVLIIDDDRDTALGAAMRLRHAGQQVLLERDGVRGLSRAIEQRPDIILLDLHMPTTDGLTTLCWLREHATTAQIPIVAFSADQSLRQIAHLMGVSHFITKPYHVNTFVEDVRSIAAGSANATRRERKFNLRIETNRLQQNINRVHTSLGKLSAVLKSVYGRAAQSKGLAAPKRSDLWNRNRNGT